MKRSIQATFFLALAVMMICVVAPAPAKDKPADDMQTLWDKIKADKKLLVAANLELTESEVKGFWPVYEAYQQDLTAINQRLIKLIESYAAAYEADALTDEKARALTAELVSIKQAEGGLQAAYLPKLTAVLPPKKVAVYLQVENKIRAVLMYEIAVEIPLVE